MATKVLKLTFTDAENNNTTISLANPKEGLTQEQTKAAMEQIASANAFSRLGVNKFAKVVGAKYYTTQSDAIFSNKGE